MRKLFALLFALFMSGAAIATILPSGFSFGIGASVLGGMNIVAGFANRDAQNDFWRKFGFRADFSSSAPVKSIMNSTTRSLMGDGVHVGNGLNLYQGEIYSRGGAALIDFYPVSSCNFWHGLRLTGGYAAGNLNLWAKLTGPYMGAPANAFVFQVFDTYYYYAGNVISGSAKIDWTYSGVYFGIGYETAIFGNIAIYLDFGAIVSGRSPHLELNMPFNNLYQYDSASGKWQNVNSPQLQGAVDNAKNNAVQDANRKLSRLKVLPVVKIGFVYRF